MRKSDSETIAWLRDRAEISDLLYRLVRLLDTKQWAAYNALYAEDGVLELPWTTMTRQMMEAPEEPRLLRKMFATHHISSNHQIAIHGDTATSNSYLMAMHLVKSDEQESQWLVAGWYDNAYRRTAEGWEITRSKVTAVYEIGKRPETG
jgi:3-phenylpropionate/cinnamic acid dioxygenase small subunit